MAENYCIHWQSNCDLASEDFALRDREGKGWVGRESCRSPIAQRSLPDSCLMLREWQMLDHSIARGLPCDTEPKALVAWLVVWKNNWFGIN